jgi:Protein of unknown function (DUF4239)
MLSLYWVYDIPNWLFAILCIGVFVAFGLLGLTLTRRFVRRVHREDHSHNDVVGFYLAAVTVFYGITLGLVAVGTWTNYSAVQDRVDHEAQTLASLYRDLDGYPDPYRTRMTGDLKAYASEVIHGSWPQQRQGIIPVGTDAIITRLQRELLAYKPADLGEQALQAQALEGFSRLSEARRSRIDSIYMSLSPALWWMVIVGALTCIVVTFFFDMRSPSMHRWMTGLMGGLLGLMIFLIAVLDNPFRGKVSVEPESMERVYQMLMK